MNIIKYFEIKIRVERALSNKPPILDQFFNEVDLYSCDYYYKKRLDI